MGFYRDHILPRGVNFCLNTRECRTLRERVTSSVRGVVLEVGFGSGLNLPYLTSDVELLYAVDPATVGRKLARQRLKECAVPVEFIGLDGRELPLGSSSVDCVLSTWTLCTIPDLPAALAEIQRVLRPGGHFHFLEHGLCPDPRVARWQHRLNSVQRIFAGGCQLNLPIDGFLRDAGFDLGELENFYMKGPRFVAYMYQGIAVPPTRDVPSP